jgi:hypothetical protein
VGIALVITPLGSQLSTKAGVIDLAIASESAGVSILDRLAEIPLIYPAARFAVDKRNETL